MFFRRKRVGEYEYLQIVENWREGKRSRQRVVATLGRTNDLIERGGVDALARSLDRFTTGVKLAARLEADDLENAGETCIGPRLAFGRIWDDLSLPAILRDLLAERRFDFPVDKAIFSTVLHRLFETGADRQAVRWLEDKDVLGGGEDLRLHHFYRAMGWLGTVKDRVEEGLFVSNSDLFTELSLVFFDTTSLYFHGRGGETLGRLGHSKDHRPDCKQVVVGALLTETGRPLACDIAPGNQTDVKSLLPVVDSARRRFDLKRVCWVADRGMFGREVIEGLEERKMEYILGARMRSVREVRDEVIGRAGRYREVAGNLHVKEVHVGGHRYIVCFNPEEAKKDRADREAIAASLAERLSQGPKALIGNRGFRRYLKVESDAVSVDPAKLKGEARFDGKYVLRTNTALPADEVAIQYKRLWRVERFFRSAKSLLETRPIFHHHDDTIRGHIFCSFLALALRHELETRLAAKGWKLEWADIVRDLSSLRETEVSIEGRKFVLRKPLAGSAGKVLQAIGVRIPPASREVG